MKKILPFLALLLVGCSSFDEVSIQESPIIASVATEEMATRATLVENTTTLAEVFPTMTIQTGSTKIDVATTELVKGNYNTGWYWGNSSKTFVSYPSGIINPTISDGTMSFDFELNENNADKDIVVAVDKKNNAPLEFKYRHIFCTVNVIYKSLQTAHNVSAVYVQGQSSGHCTVSSSTVSWQKPTDSSSAWTWSDLTARKAYYNEQNMKVTPFMLVPLTETVSRPKVTIIIDGKSISHVVECAPEAGKIINVYVVDKDGKTDFTEIEEAHVSDEKKVITEDDGSYSIQLTPYITGTITSEKVSIPTNTVLVLDASGSMKDVLTNAPLATHRYEKVNGWYKMTDNGFEGLDVEKASSVEGYYVASVSAFKTLRDVRYSDGSWQYHNETFNMWKTIMDSNFQITIYRRKSTVMKAACVDFVEALAKTGDTHYVSVVEFGVPTYGATTLANSIDVNSATGKSDLITAINKVTYNGATPADEGFKSAKSLMKDKSKYYNSIIFITDGEPNHGSGFDSDVANTTVSLSNDCKVDYDCHVYSIGIFDSGSKPSNSCVGFMERVSSNYKGATTYTNGERVSSSYYSLATTEDAVVLMLNNAYQEIDKATASLPVDGTAELRFIFSDLFDLSSASLIAPAACNYNTDWRTTGTLVITGFNYQSLMHANFLIQNLKLKDPNFKGTACSFLSGSGLWYKGVCVEEFHGTDFTL